MGVSNKIRNFMEQGSWIRKMFEEGIALKQEHGEKNVFDLSDPTSSLTGALNVGQWMRDHIPSFRSEDAWFNWKKIFIDLIKNAGYPNIRFEKKVDFEKMYNDKFN